MSLQLCYIFQTIGDACRVCKLISDSERDGNGIDGCEVLGAFVGATKFLKDTKFVELQEKNLETEVILGELGEICKGCNIPGRTIRLCLTIFLKKDVTLELLQEAYGKVFEEFNPGSSCNVA